MIAAVTAGPAAAILNSSPGVAGSRARREMPPKNHRSMLLVSIPCRRAASAWPSSCRMIEAKNRIAARGRDDVGRRARPAEDLAEVVLQDVDQEEQDQEPARADPDPDAEQPGKLDGSASHASHRRRRCVCVSDWAAGRSAERHGPRGGAAWRSPLPGGASGRAQTPPQPRPCGGAGRRQNGSALPARRAPARRTDR